MICQTAAGSNQKDCRHVLLDNGKPLLDSIFYDFGGTIDAEFIHNLPPACINGFRTDVDNSGDFFGCLTV